MGTLPIQVCAPVDSAQDLESGSQV